MRNRWYRAFCYDVRGPYAYAVHLGFFQVGWVWGGYPELRIFGKTVPRPFFEWNLD